MPDSTNAEAKAYSLNAHKITNLLKSNVLGDKLYLYDEVTSTFDKANELPLVHGTVICAKRQSGGCGRLGRIWESREGGIYFSLILSVAKLGEIYPIITNACAVGVQRAISHYTPCLIKWPNDIITPEGKKLCGILTKMRTMGNDTTFINVGIGINVNNINFGKELVYATSLSEILGSPTDENKLLCGVLEETEKVLCLDKKNIIDEYSKQCITVNSKVRAIYAASGDEIKGTCVKIEEDGSAIIKTDNGDYISVNSGEVSVRGVYGENYV